MTLISDVEDAKVMTLQKSIFPKGTKGYVKGCEFIGGTSERVYLFQTDEKIKGLVDGMKTAWYLDRDLINVIED